MKKKIDIYLQYQSDQTWQKVHPDSTLGLLSKFTLELLRGFFLEWAQSEPLSNPPPQKKPPKIHPKKTESIPWSEVDPWGRRYMPFSILNVQGLGLTCTKIINKRQYASHFNV